MLLPFFVSNIILGIHTYFTLKVDAADFSEIMVNIYETKCPHKKFSQS